MYSFTPALQDAWRDLFRSLHRHLESDASETFEIRFDDPDYGDCMQGHAVLHTCGYPYVSGLRDTHQLICVPEFDVPGTRDMQYASWFVVRSQDKRHSLEQFRDAVAVINGRQSNSGMNVFRHAISKIAGSERFFKGVLISGSHLRSVDLIRRGVADIAAIDAVTWDLAMRQEIVHSADLKTIGISEHTAGLPFVTETGGDFRPADLCAAFNACLGELAPRWADLLRIRTFTPVTPDQYDRIALLEQEACQAGYPQLS